MKQTEPCSQQEAVDHQIERSLRGDPCRAAAPLAYRRQSLCHALTHSRPQEESGFGSKTRPGSWRKPIWCRYWSGEVSQIASRTLEIVDQLLFAEVKRIGCGYFGTTLQTAGYRRR
jgi:hypothetical protein